MSQLIADFEERTRYEPRIPAVVSAFLIFPSTEWNAAQFPVSCTITARFSEERSPMSPIIQPLIQKKPGVCGGDPCIAGTRIPVWVLEQCRQLDMTLSEILADYPTLTVDDVIAAWKYADENRAEIKRQISENRGG